MKKIISIFLILCMMATLLPTVAFATEGEEATVDPIVANFTTVTLSSDSKLQGATATGFTIVEEESTTQKAYKITNNSVSYLKVSTYKSDAGKFYVWPDQTVQGLMFTINVNCENPGYYIPDVVHGKSNVGGKYAVYINGQYAGDIQTRDNSLGETSDTAEKTITKNEATLNAVKLQEGENEISFRLSEQYLRNWETTELTKSASLLYLNKLTLTPCEEAFVPVEFSYDFPEKVVAGEVAEFTVSANINEALTKFFGTYNEDGLTMDKNLTVASENGTFDITEQSASVVKGTFTATAGGTAIITATANVNGKAYTQTIETTAVAPIVATFPQNGDYAANVGYPIENLLQGGNGYTVDTTKSIEGTPVKNYDGFVMIQFYVDKNSWTGYPWPTRNENGFIFTINVEAAEAGYYASEFKHKASNLGAGFTMYVNGVAQGEIDGYVKGLNKVSDELTTNLNTVYLNAGPNEISFRLTKTYKRHTDAEGTVEASTYNGFWLYPRTLTFTPVDAAPTPVGFESTLTEVKAGEPVEFTVKPVMSDGVDMYFGTYDDAGTKITDTPITLTSSSGEVTNLTRTTEGVSGTFTATEAGCATITASTTINGTLYENTFDVNVTSDEDEVVTLPTTISMSVATDEAFAGNLVVNGAVQSGATQVYGGIAVGKEVTVVANDIEGKIFRGWLRGGTDGVVVSLEPEYNFKAATNVALFAQYTEAPADNAEAKEYYDWNGEFLAYEEPERATLSKYGFSFKEWLESAAEKVIRYVADYQADGTYVITKPDGTKEENVLHETLVTLTNATPVSWYSNGALVAYGTSYSFYATEDAKITVDSEVQEGPIVKLSNPEGNTYILEYNANDANVIEKGIIIGNGTPKVTSCFYKVISQRDDDFGKLMTNNDTGYSVVRGYVIYNDNGTYRVAYADIAE